MCEKCAVARYVRNARNRFGCPASGCPELCPVSGCLVCPAARYARLSGTMPDCPEICPAVRLPENMPGCPKICPASALRLRLDAQRQPSAVPLATSTDRHERWHATTPKDRAQLRGRASGVRCTQCWAACDNVTRKKGS